MMNCYYQAALLKKKNEEILKPIQKDTKQMSFLHQTHKTKTLHIKNNIKTSRYNMAHWLLLD